MKLSTSIYITLSLSPGYTQAQRPQFVPGVQVVQSKLGNGITISYKEPGICETNKDVKSYSGYIHLPPRTLAPFNITQNYPMNLFYWYFQARKNPESAPFALWLNGGPGASSMRGLLRENGPCSINTDSNSTTSNPWSWNEVSNMIYIDQPVQTRFSYDVLQNSSVDLLTGRILDAAGGITPPNITILAGTFPSLNVASTTNSSTKSARALYYALQVFLQDAFFHKSSDTRFSVWAESYGGKYGPAIADFIIEQNKRIATGQLTGNTAFKPINFDTLGIVNGSIDVVDELSGGLLFKYNNTYGFQKINETQYRDAVARFNQPGGCKEAILRSRRVAAQYDPTNQGGNDSVNALFKGGPSSPWNAAFMGGFRGRDEYDIGGPTQDPFPPPYMYGFLAQQWVLNALGVPVNYTDIMESVDTAFSSVGDYSRAGYAEALEHILDAGGKVALMFGDRDSACSWPGGDATALNLKHLGSAGYKSSGYAQFKTNETYNGGLVRQDGGLSFIRVYQAGHEVPAYQPQTALEIFRRVTHNFDLPTGTKSGTNFTSRGLADPFGVRVQLPKLAQPVCYLYQLSSTCPAATLAALSSGKAQIDNYIVTPIAKNPLGI